jgi:hypothetical protein
VREIDGCREQRLGSSSDRLAVALRSISLSHLILFLAFTASVLLPVHAQTSYTISLLGGRWSSYAISVEVPNATIDMHDLTVQAMETWNAAQAWFVGEYYPNGDVYNLAVSGTGVVKIFFDLADQWDPSHADTYAYMGPQSSGNSFVSAEIHIRYLNSSNYLDQNHWYNAILHELGHVLGLGHSNATYANDVMAHALWSSRMQPSTLDLYAVQMLVQGQYDGVVTLPSTIPYMLFNGLAVPEFPGELAMVAVLFVVVSFACSIQRRKRVQQIRT